MALPETVIAMVDRMQQHRTSHWDDQLERTRVLIAPDAPRFGSANSTMLPGATDRDNILDNHAEITSRLFSGALQGLLTNPIRRMVRTALTGYVA